MSAYLIEREKDELTKPVTRTMTFPDGTAHELTMSAVHWRWYDRIDAYEFGKGAGYLLSMVQSMEKREDNIAAGWTLSSILEYVIDHEVRFADKIGLDLTETDLDLQLMVAKKATMRFHARNPKKPKS